MRKYIEGIYDNHTKIHYATKFGMSANSATCTCTHHIDDHERKPNNYQVRMGKCLKCPCSQFRCNKYMKKRKPY